MKWLVLAGLAVTVFLAGLMVGCERTKAQAAVAYSQLAHQHDAAVAELTSAKQVAADVPILRDSLAHYRGRPQASTRLVVHRDTVRIRDTVFAAGAAADSLTDTLVFPPITRQGITVLERLAFTPPIPPTRITRWVVATTDPDSISVLLLRQPDGLLRFVAAAEREGVRLHIADAAALQPPERSRFGFGCAVGPSLAVTLAGQAYGGVGATCGLAVRF